MLTPVQRQKTMVRRFHRHLHVALDERPCADRAEDENGFRPISLRPTASSPAWASLKLFDGFPDDATTQKVSGSLMKVILFGATAWWDREYSSNAWTAPQWKASWPSDGAPPDAGTPNSPK